MASVNFYEFYYDGMFLRAERSLDKLVKWIGRNKSVLDVGCYYIEYDGVKLVNVFKDADGRVHLE